ncbi:hypothetical protein [Phenylobacterium deserti]|uniref:DUF2188 domain-containing protein n=1 Tax=Phenylobacterium deserti TaxID=1914756 RepID=A0A328AQI6_9CAUL|nr:hypothetical protein [Phenylobacterium deserti]RAK56571.1 hypothetical protein DJ018_00885 [Phenylobacterium deserti]
MADVHYGVVQQNGAWTIIGDHLKFGRYRRRSAAIRAARRLGETSSGLAFQLHVQDECGQLRRCESD